VLSGYCCDGYYLFCYCCLTGDITDNGAFTDLSSGLNQVLPVGAETNLSPDPLSSVGATGLIPDYSGMVTSLIDIGLSSIRIGIFLLTGSIQVVQLIDTGNVFSLLLLAPIAMFQVFYVLFIFITLTSLLLGSLRGISG